MRALIVLFTVACVTLSPTSHAAQAKRCGDELKGLSDMALLNDLRNLKKGFESKLQPIPDLFSRALGFEEERRLYSRLMSKSGPEGPTLSLFGELSAYFLTHAPTSPAELKPWIARVRDESRRVLKDRASKTADYFRGLEALNILIAGLAPLVREPVKDPQQSVPDSLATAVNYPEVPDTYLPSTLALAEDNGVQPLHVLTRVNVAGIQYFRQKVFAFVRYGSLTPFAVAEMPGASTEVMEYRETKYVLEVDPLGNRNVPLSIPIGFVPVQLSSLTGAHLERRTDGSYILFSKGHPLEIFLMRENETLNPAQIDFLKQPVGLALERWPQDLQNLIEQTKSLTSVERLRAIEKYLREKPDFSLDALPETDPVKALERGSFQCSLANYIMLALVRDVLHLPARIGAGFVGRGHTGDSNSYIVLPDVVHAWNEVYLDGEWKIFDPTPEGLRRALEQTSRPKRESDFYSNRAAASGRLSKPDPSNYPGHQNQTQPNDSNLSTQEKSALAKSLEFSDVTERAFHLFLRQALDPSLETQQSVDELEVARAGRLLKNPERQKIVDRAEALLRTPQKSIAETLTALANDRAGTPLNEIYATLGLLESRLALFISLQDPQDRPPLNQRLSTLRDIKQTLRSFNDATTPLKAQVEKFLNELPPLTREVLIERYGASESGAIAFAEDLNQGNLSDFNLVRLLNPLVDFVLPGKPRPVRREVSRSGQDLRVPRGNSFLPAIDLSRAYQALRLQPEKSHFENFQEGTLWQPVRRLRRRLPDPGPITALRNLTLELYDTSLSLAGPPGDFLAALLATFTDRSLSDVDEETGELLRKCLLLGFDKKVHTVTEVYDTAQAKRVVENPRNAFKNTGGVTDIRQALADAVGYAEQAQREHGYPLEDIDIMLVSDGGAPIAVDELKRILSPIDDETAIGFVFISINGHNPALEELANSARAAGARAFYRDFNMEAIKKYLLEARHLPIPNLDKELFSSQTYADLPKDMAERFNSLSRALVSDLSELQRKQSPQPESTWRSQLRNARVSESAGQEHPLVLAEIAKLRTLLGTHPALQQRAIVRLIFDDFLKRFEDVFGIPINKLNLQEHVGLELLLEEVATYSSVHR